MLLKFNDVGGLIWYTTTNKGNNNKNPRQVWSRWNTARYDESNVPVEILEIRKNRNSLIRESKNSEYDFLRKISEAVGPVS